MEKTKTAEKTDQILLLVDHILTLWEKKDRWTCVYCSYAGYGRNGLLEDRREGDGTTPVGDFALPLAFGIRENPGTALPWKLASYDPQYRYAVFIAYNADPFIPGKGSAIFLHVKNDADWKTAGCVSVTEKNMIRLLQSLRPGARMLIVKKPEDIGRY